MNLYALILAGGSGTRLWPYSRRNRPKQLLALVGETSMLEQSVTRLAPLVPPERVFVLTAAAYAAEVRTALPQIPPDQVVGEPAALGTAAAIGLGMTLVRARDPEAVMCVVTADHLIAPEDAFRAALADAARVAAAGWLVTFGVRAAAPETSFGYIEFGRRLGAEDLSTAAFAATASPSTVDPDTADQVTLSAEPLPEAYTVARFVEKPDRATAEGYIAAGTYAWNSGMFAWTAPILAAEIARHLPDLAARLGEIGAAVGRPDFEARLAEIWSRVTDRTTIDYGIMERSDRVACLPAHFQWRDIGAWDSLKAALPADAEGNAVVGEHLGQGTHGSLIFAKGGRLVATIGVENLVIVDTGDALLVCALDRVQEVKAIVARLAARDDGADLL